MPRPKKTTPTVIDPVITYDITPAKLPEFAHPLPPPHMADDYLKAKVGVATTEPDTTLNPDRAQVAAVADLPHAHEPAPVTSVFRVEQVPDQSDPEAHINATDDVPTLRRIAIGWMETAAQHLRNEEYYRGLLNACAPHLGDAVYTQDDGGRVPDPLRAKVPELVAEQSARIAELEAELVRVALESLTPADLIAGYRAVASGQVKAAEWKGRRLVRLHGNPEPIAMYDHPEPPPGCMPSGFVAEVASGTTRVMSPPLKDEAEARAWCEARCGWTVVA